MTWLHASKARDALAIRAVVLAVSVAGAGCVSLSGGAPGPRAELTLSADRDTFATAAEPVTLYLTLRNTGRQPFVICPTRIESQRSVKYAAVRDKSAFPPVTEPWERIPAAAADHFRREPEEYVTVAPGGSYRWTDTYYTAAKVLTLVRPGQGNEGAAGRYFVRAYFDAGECGVRDAPPEIMPLLLKARLVSNTITLRLQQ